MKVAVSSDSPSRVALDVYVDEDTTPSVLATVNLTWEMAERLHSDLGWLIAARTAVRL